MLSEISQTEKDKYRMISLIWGIKNKTSSYSHRTDWWLPEGYGIGGRAKWVKGINCTGVSWTYSGEHYAVHTNIDYTVLHLSLMGVGSNGISPF